MPAIVAAKGGQQFISNLRYLGQDQARETLAKLKTHFELPGKGQGTMTLHGRTRSGEDMEIRRKSGWQLLCRGDRNERLNDTVTAVRTLLDRAGLGAARGELDAYLEAQPAGNRNRIPVGTFVRILKDRLNAEPLADGNEDLAGAGEADQTNTLPLEEILQPNPETLPLISEEPPAIQPDSALPSPAPGATGALNHTFTPRQLKLLAENDSYRQRPLGNPEQVLQKLGITVVRSLGKGASGDALLVQLPNDPQERVFKGFQINKRIVEKKPKVAGYLSVTPLTYERDRPANEANAAYLHSSKRPDLSASLSIVPYDRYVVAYDRQDGNGPHIESLDPRQLRSLLKEAAQKDSSGRPVLDPEGRVKMDFPVNCLGQLMPLAAGTIGTELRGTLDPDQLRRYAQASIQGLKANAALGIVHRDIKPANEFFDPTTGKVSEIDPSMVFRQSRNRPELQYCPANVAGSPNYMHPRALAKANHSFETDLYAKAISLVELAHPEGTKLVRLLVSDDEVTGVEPGDRPPTWDGAHFRRRVGEALRDPRLNDDQRKSLRELRAAIDDPRSPVYFATKMLDLAARPAKDWVVRTRAEQMYDQLLADPYLTSLGQS